MACFLVPAAEAIVVGVSAKVEKTKKHDNTKTEEITGLSMHEKLALLTKMLVGGSVLLCFEHIWHGEVQLSFPFLTAMNSADTMAEMFTEIGTVGVTMAAIVTCAWAGICIVADSVVKRVKKERA